LCSDNCTLISGEGPEPVATVSNVGVVGDVTDGVLFQIEGIPDCRLIPQACIAILDDVNTPADLVAQGVIIDRQGLGDPSAMLLNVKRLLPAEVTEPFAGLIPDLWIEEKYLAQAEKGYFINALFAVTDATFQGVYEIELDVKGLTGDERGCVGEVLPLNTPAAYLIANQDVAVKASEDYRSVDRDYIPGRLHPGPQRPCRQADQHRLRHIARSRRPILAHRLRPGLQPGYVRSRHGPGHGK
jgi:hypothetical protein